MEFTLKVIECINEIGDIIVLDATSPSLSHDRTRNDLNFLLGRDRNESFGGTLVASRAQS